MKRFLMSAAAGALLMTLAPTAGQAQTAGAPAPSARQMELAHKVITDVGGARAVDQIVHAMISQMKKNQSAAGQQVADTVVTPALEAAMDKIVPKMMDAMTLVYAQTYSEQELTDIDAFYQSPSGRSMNAKLPQIAMGMGQAMAGIQVEMRHDMVDEMCKRMVCTDVLRARMLGLTPPGQTPPVPPPPLPVPSKN